MKRKDLSSFRATTTDLGIFGLLPRRFGCLVVYNTGSPQAFVPSTAAHLMLIQLLKQNPAMQKYSTPGQICKKKFHERYLTNV